MRWIVWLTFLLVPLLSIGQQRTVGSGFFPEVQLTHKAGQAEMTAKIESQHGLVDSGNDRPTNFGHAHDRTDFQGFVGTALNPFTKWAVGYQYRWNGDDENSHRSIQQIAWVQQNVKNRIGHRVRTDQTFSESEKPLYRFRYRLAIEFPLSGSKVDDGEFYLVLSEEPIYGYQTGTSSLENRLVGSVGHYFNKKHKVEAGIDHRIDRFLDSGSRQRIWLKVGWYANI